MRPAFGPDRDLPGDPEPTADLVLGAPALLGIFFAAALLCAVCFGFGYSSGHTPRSTALVDSDQTAGVSQPAGREDVPPASMLPGPSAAAPQDQGAGTETGFPPAEPAPSIASKPIPGSGYLVQKPPAALPAETQDLPASGSAPAPAPRMATAHRSVVLPQDMNTVPTTTQAAAPAVTSPRVASVPYDAPADASATPAVDLMVQIAAVSHAADAQTLAAALRHDGFAAIVRTTTGDPLFHVQVGPFSTLQAAKAMRARLTGNGYNAFIKP